MKIYSLEYAKTMGNTLVSRIYGTLEKARRGARQAFYFIKNTLIKTF